VGKHIHNKKDFKIGEILPIKYIPEGFKVFNIGTKANLGGNLAKSAGTYGIIIKHNENNMTSIKLSSKKVINISSDCCATIGKASNVLHINRIDGKAGLAR
jgi:large subunit ribosomal protein L2